MQLDLLSGIVPSTKSKAATEPARPVEQTIEERFTAFDQANPHVFAEMLRLARARLARGEKRIGVKALWEELRSWLQVTGAGDYKLNNTYTALYSRKLIESDPTLAHVIEVRRRKGERKNG